jgi:hypothetical protein
VSSVAVMRGLCVVEPYWSSALLCVLAVNASGHQSGQAQCPCFVRHHQQLTTAATAKSTSSACECVLWQWRLDARWQTYFSSGVCREQHIREKDAAVLEAEDKGLKYVRTAGEYGHMVVDVTAAISFYLCGILRTDQSSGCQGVCSAQAAPKVFLTVMLQSAGGAISARIVVFFNTHCWLQSTVGGGHCWTCYTLSSTLWLRPVGGCHCWKCGCGQWGVA